MDERPSATHRLTTHFQFALQLLESRIDMNPATVRATPVQRIERLCNGIHR
jgi:hypothetical protein